MTRAFCVCPHLILIYIIGGVSELYLQQCSNGCAIAQICNKIASAHFFCEYDSR